MKNKSARRLYLFCCVFFLSLGSNVKANTFNSLPFYYPDPIPVTLSTNWQEYSLIDGVLIEYRMKKIDSHDYGRQVNMLLFRFTNTTTLQKECSWIVKIERNKVCYNCDDLENPDEVFELHLDPKEIVEGNASNLITRSELNIFGEFVKLVPGMTPQKLTGFELINLTIK